MADSIEILLVEDNPADVRLTIEALKEGKIKNNLHIANDGEEALDFLFKRNNFENAIRPDVVLLDLNLPKIDGKTVLQKVKSDPELKRIPVVVLTTSKEEEDIIKSYDLHANCYITKPLGLGNFIEVVKNIESFWFTIVKLPEK